MKDFYTREELEAMDRSELKGIYGDQSTKLPTRKLIEEILDTQERLQGDSSTPEQWVDKADEDTATERKQVIQDVWKRKYRIILNKTADMQGQSKQFFSINNYACRIPFDTEVEVPEPIVNLLKNCKYTIYPPSEHGKPKQPPQKVNRFAFSIIEGPIED